MCVRMRVSMYVFMYVWDFSTNVHLRSYTEAQVPITRTNCIGSVTLHASLPVLTPTHGTLSTPDHKPPPRPTLYTKPKIHITHERRSNCPQCLLMCGCHLMPTWHASYVLFSTCLCPCARTCLHRYSCWCGRCLLSCGHKGRRESG